MGIRGRVNPRQGLLLTTGLAAAVAGLWVGGARVTGTSAPRPPQGTAVVGLASCLQPDLSQRAAPMITQVECFRAVQAAPVSQSLS